MEVSGKHSTHKNASLLTLASVKGLVEVQRLKQIYLSEGCDSYSPIVPEFATKNWNRTVILMDSLSFPSRPVWATKKMSCYCGASLEMLPENSLRRAS